MNRTFVITGVTSGIGLALTRQLLSDGHRVFGCGRRTNPLPDESNNLFSYRQVDVLDPVGLGEWSEEVQEKHQIDFLVQNAGYLHEPKYFRDIKPEEFDTVFNINVKGTVNVLQAFLPKMLDVKHGIIVTMSSGAGRYGIAKMSDYCASKFAVEGLTRTLAEELPEPMAAIPLSPGMVDTPMLQTTMGSESSQHISPEAWATRAAPFILGLTRKENGQSLVSG